jgi:hypothetical protein
MLNFRPGPGRYGIQFKPGPGSVIGPQSTPINPAPVLPALANVWIFNRASALTGAAGDSVSAWTCTAGTGRSWTQVSTGQNPVIAGTGNSRAVAFDGTDDVLVSSANWAPGNVLHVFFVLELLAFPSVGGPTGACLMRNSSTSASTSKNFSIQNNTTATPSDRLSFNQHNNTSWWVTGPAALSLNTLVLQEFIIRNTSAAVLVNGTSGTAKNLSMTDSAQEWRLGASGPTGFAAINARVRDVLMCTSVQSNAADIRAYFTQFHGIT